MEVVLIVIFTIGYILITLEHPLRLDKTVTALIMAAVLWALVAIGFYNGWFTIVDAHHHSHDFLVNGAEAEDGFKNALLHHLAKTAEILIFLICAMTIVELIDLHRGFSVVRGFVETKSRKRLLWVVGVLAFFLSATIDNLTATIVIVTLLRLLVTDDERRWWFVGMAIIAANAGGAWSPIGDVTTTMLWISDKVTAIGLVKYLLIPSFVCFLVPFAIASYLKPFRGFKDFKTNEDTEAQTLLSSKKMLFLGIGAIVFVPIFKTITHLPPYLGMMLGLGVVWLVSGYIRPKEHLSRSERQVYSAKRALRHIEMTSILFFLGILMSVAALETTVYGLIDGKEVGTLRYFAEIVEAIVPYQDLVVIILGIFSAIIDNVPLVAGSMAMYTEAIDSKLWHFIAYCAGTGGSMLIIGSAAGVTAMGMENMDFGWYLKRITWLAALGFIGGAFTFLLLFPFIA